MRIFKLIIISFVILFAIITIISLFIPSNVRISKTVQINVPKDSVMAQLSDPVNWKNWYPVNDTFHFFYIDGKIRGIGLDSLTGLMITAKKDSEVIAAYVGPGSKDIIAGWKVMSADNTSAVEWYMNFHLNRYPWEKF